MLRPRFGIQVHLAATPGAPDDPEGFFGSLLPLNIIGCYNAFQAAAAAGCKRIVFASSVNAVLGYVAAVGETVILLTPPLLPYHAD